MLDMKSKLWPAWVLSAVFLLSACEDGSNSLPSDAVSSTNTPSLLSLHDFGTNDKNVVVCFGDSITGETIYSGTSPYPTHLALLVPAMTIVNSGIGGERTDHAVARVISVLSANKPGYLLILFGTNDIWQQGTDYAAMAENLRVVVRAAKTNKTIPIIATVPPMVGSRSYYQTRISALNTLIKTMADDEGVQVVDLAQLFDGAGVETFPDTVHPSDVGHSMIAAAFYVALQDPIPASVASVGMWGAE